MAHPPQVLMLPSSVCVCPREDQRSAGAGADGGVRVGSRG